MIRDRQPARNAGIIGALLEALALLLSAGLGFVLLKFKKLKSEVSDYHKMRAEFGSELRGDSTPRPSEAPRFGAHGDLFDLPSRRPGANENPLEPQPREQLEEETEQRRGSQLKRSATKSFDERLQELQQKALEVELVQDGRRASAP